MSLWDLPKEMLIKIIEKINDYSSLDEKEFIELEKKINKERYRRNVIKKLERVKLEMYYFWLSNKWDLCSKYFPDISFQKYKEIIDFNLVLNNFSDLKPIEDKNLAEMVKYVSPETGCAIYNTVYTYLISPTKHELHCVFYNDYGKPLFNI